MATLSLTWKDFNLNEDGFNIYRSETPMDVNNMPAPIATVGANIGSYDDTTGVNGTTYYYRVGAVRGSEEKISPELERVFDVNSWEKHDVFGDGSAVATYKFDGDATDLGGNYDGIWSNTESYVDGVIGRAASFDGSTIIENTSLSVPSTFSASFWINIDRLDKRMGFLSIGDVNIGRENNTTAGRNNWDIIIVKGVGTNTAYSYDFGANIGEWNHVYFDNELNVYVNSVLLTTSVGSLSWDVSTKNLLIGEFSVYESKLEGKIDQLRIFNRALTQEEVNTLYQ